MSQRVQACEWASASEGRNVRVNVLTPHIVAAMLSCTIGAMLAELLQYGMKGLDRFTVPLSAETMT
jgi:hypothetical protein